MVDRPVRAEEGNYPHQMERATVSLCALIALRKAVFLKKDPSLTARSILDLSE